MTKLTAKNWRKEFEELKYRFAHSGQPDTKVIKSFISNLLKTAVKDLAGEIKKNITSSEFNYIDGYGQMRLNIPKFLSFIEEVLERGELWIK